MTIEPKTFDFSLEDGVATVRLNRPDRINALTFESYAELRDTFEAFHRHPEIRVVVLEGAGERGFCSGGDVRDIIGQLFGRDMPGLLEFTRLTGSLVQAIRTTRPPVIAKLHGVVCGAGAVIAAACDLRYGTPDCRIAYLFPKVGLSGADMGAAYLLPRLVGHGRASEILLTGDWIPADRAEEIGLLNGTAAREELDDMVAAMAKIIAEGPAFAHSMTKRMLEYEAHVDFKTAIEAEAQAQAVCMAHPDFQEAYNASVEKRPPRFK